LGNHVYYTQICKGSKEKISNLRSYELKDGKIGEIKKNEKMWLKKKKKGRKE